jgi:hypothetical protein
MNFIPCSPWLVFCGFQRARISKTREEFIRATKHHWRKEMLSGFIIEPLLTPPRGGAPGRTALRGSNTPSIDWEQRRCAGICRIPVIIDDQARRRCGGAQYYIIHSWNPAH